MANPVRPHVYVDGETADALRVNEDFNTIYGWASTEAMHRDASTSFTSFPSGPGSGVPSQPSQLANKRYVDQAVAQGVAPSAAIYRHDVRSNIFTVSDLTEAAIPYGTIEHIQGPPGETPTYVGGSQSYNVGKNGIYTVTAGIDGLALSGNASQHTQLRIFRGGSSVAANSAVTTLGGVVRCQVTFTGKFTSSTPISVRLFHRSGGSMRVQPTSMSYITIAWQGIAA